MHLAMILPTPSAGRLLATIESTTEALSSSDRPVGASRVSSSNLEGVTDEEDAAGIGGDGQGPLNDPFADVAPGQDPFATQEVARPDDDVRGRTNSQVWHL